MKKNKIDDETMFCIDCGVHIHCPDFYAQNSLQRCPECNKKHRTTYKADKAKEYRRIARERRAEERTEVDLLRQQNTLLKAEIDNLKYLVKAQREQIEVYINPDYSGLKTKSELFYDGIDTVNYIREEKRKKNY